jgi:hypothetical protein
MMLYELIGKWPPIATPRRRDHRRCGRAVQRRSLIDAIVLKLQATGKA